MRLIDADALAYEILSEYGADGGTKDVNTIYGMVINAPAIDAEPVVRCKDCRHGEKMKTKLAGRITAVFCHKNKKERFMLENDYCSYCERREP